MLQPNLFATLEHTFEGAIVDSSDIAAFAVAVREIDADISNIDRIDQIGARPAPDSMAYLTALLPMKDAVAVHATLSRDADTIMCTHDVVERTKNQIMADLLVERCTGASTATGVPVEVVIVISDEALLAGGQEPAHAHGYGSRPHWRVT